MIYKYSKGKSVQNATKIFYSSWSGQYGLPANRSMTVYNSPNSGKKVKTVVKGQMITIDKLYINSKCTVIYLHVKLQSGKTGWEKGLKDTFTENKMFQEVEYAR
ncbi:MAG: hypothetical protein ACI4S2_13540 [Lachnospiraceae bacterium]